MGCIHTRTHKRVKIRRLKWCCSAFKQSWFLKLLIIFFIIFNHRIFHPIYFSFFNNMYKLDIIENPCRQEQQAYQSRSFELLCQNHLLHIIVLNCRANPTLFQLACIAIGTFEANRKEHFLPLQSSVA